MNTRPIELAVGLFLLLGFAALLALAFASTNGKLPMGGETYSLTARFSNVGELRERAPVKIGGVAIGEVADIRVDPKTFDAVVTLQVDGRFDDIPSDTSASIFTSGLLGERYVGLQPGGAPDALADGDELMLTQSAVVLEELIGKYIFGGAGGEDGGSGGNAAADSAAVPADATGDTSNDNDPNNNDAVDDTGADENAPAPAADEEE